MDTCGHWMPMAKAFCALKPGHRGAHRSNDMTQYSLNYYWANREKQLDNSRKYRAANRERLNQHQRDYVKANRNRHDAHAYKRRALKRNVLHIPWTRQGVIDQYGTACYLCGSPIDLRDWHADHVIPISRGGFDILENLRPTHPSCNCSKNARVDYSDPFVVGVINVCLEAKCAELMELV